MRVLTGFIALLVATLLSATNASAQFYCSRHFYNNSNYTWTVSNAVVQRKIPPRTTQSLNYLSIGSQTLRIRSPFYDQSFPVSFCYLNHSGGTGYIAVNDPANGDVQTCGNPGWPCPAMRSSRKNRQR
ncbi:hypothetical protein [Bradyrhizobium sp.]|uniref:hypothetical protein n=1 Tax=Bradyrhizobium sp. TaxID=376 RepID=UPI00271FFE03|nr:hypothetical protein [Bradyrhizobium sp.]MDO9297643.1 hypothetical protein [Bradyrhizobium sp.]